MTEETRHQIAKLLIEAIRLWEHSERSNTFASATFGTVVDAISTEEIEKEQETFPDFDF